jgi:hypothetical protein
MNLFIKVNNYSSYLEIGYKEGACFNYIECFRKVGVDPTPLCDHDKVILKTSDDFFRDNMEKFDIIHIDGYHEHQQVLRDIDNSLKILNEGGIIICHDMLPWEKWLQDSIDPETMSLGTCWKAFAELRTKREDLSMFTIPVDCGLGIILKGKQEVYKENFSNIDYDYFNKNKKALMNIKFPEYADFIKDKLGFYKVLISQNLDLDVSRKLEFLSKLNLDSRLAYD